jgi:uncharacterized membrane protein
MRFGSNARSGRLAILLAVLMLASLLPNTASATQGRAGPDVSPVAVGVYYSVTADHLNHDMLSSQTPSTNTLRSDDLWIVDGMLGLPLRIEVSIENLGDQAAASFNVDFRVIHDEYGDFILHSDTVNVASLSAGQSTVLSTTWTPDYSGNHSLVITTSLANDANTGNDIGTRGLTIGNLYDQAEVAGSWTLQSGWFVSDEASISRTSSFHIGGSTAASNYGNNWDTSLVSPVMDTSDAHRSPSNGFGIGFFYTGEILSGDGFDVDVWNGNGWQRITNTVSGVVDTSPYNNWLITVNSVSGRGVPWWNIPASMMNSQFQIRINFHSDGAGTAPGYWIDDIVMFYDQKARASEFSLATSAGLSGHARAGEWAETTLSITNQGNLSDEVTLSVADLPAGWNSRFQHMSGSQIPDGTTLDLAMGESRNVKLLVQPSEGSALGSTDVTVRAQSSAASVFSTTTASFIVDPDYEPAWLEQDPGFSCAPGNACDFEITLVNDGDGQDVFSLSTASVLSHEGWTFGLTWDQPTTVTVAEGATEVVSITANIPVDALPGMRASSAFTAISQADPSKSATMRANVTASMISIGHVGVDAADEPAQGWWISPGESITVPFTIWNNATQQDTFAFSFDTSGVFGWTIGVPTSSEVVIAPGGTARVLLSFTAPEDAQADDPGPIVNPHAVSTASGMSATESSFSGIRVRQLHDVVLSMDAPAFDIVPGEATSVPFEVENFGNGPENVLFELDGPSDWTWWVDIGGAVITGPLGLSTIYDGNQMVLGTLWIQAPGSAEPGQVHEITFTASPMDAEDASPEDSTLSWEMRTKMIAIPDIDAFEDESASVWLEQTVSWDLSLRNIGNTYDSSLRVRVTVDANQPGLFVQLNSDRGVGQLNGWVDLPMAAGAEVMLTISFQTYDVFPLGESVRITVEVEGGRVTSEDPLVTRSATILVMVDQKRNLEVTWNLDPTTRLSPGEPHEFQINVTTDSTMPITVTLGSTVPETGLLECRPRAQDGAVVLLLPASEPGPPQTSTITCEITLQANDLARTFTFTLIDDEGERVWDSGATHMKTEPPSEDGGYAIFGSLNPVLLASAGAVVFIGFFIMMATMIVRRRRTLDEIEEDDEEEDIPVTAAAPVGTPVGTPIIHGAPATVAAPQQAATAPPGPMPVAAVAPVALEPTTPSEFTDDQLRESGWGEEQIAELRGTPGPALTSAFDSLGVGTTEEAVIEATPEVAGASLPAFNCIVTGQPLTSEDPWWQCDDCSGFAAVVAIQGLSNCPRCKAPL